MEVPDAPFTSPFPFPTFHDALTRLQDTPYDAGWLAGCLVNIASSFVRLLAHLLAASTSTSASASASASTLEERITTLKLRAESHLRVFGKVDGDTPIGAVEAVDVEELVAFVKQVCEECVSMDAFDYSQRLTTAAGAGAGDGEGEGAAEGAEERRTSRDRTTVDLDDMQGRVNSLVTLRLRKALLCYFFESENEGEGGMGMDGYHEKVVELEMGLQDGIDSTPMHLTPRGPLSRSEYSFPYTEIGTEPPEGECPICKEPFTSFRLEDLVVAACSSRRHVFSHECLEAWMDVCGEFGVWTCPDCREVVYRE